MKKTDFKNFISAVAMAGKESDIWYCGYYFMDLTDKQHEETARILVSKGFPVIERNSFKGVIKLVRIPSGIELEVK